MDGAQRFTKYYERKYEVDQEEFIRIAESLKSRFTGTTQIKHRYLNSKEGIIKLQYYPDQTNLVFGKYDERLHAFSLLKLSQIPELMEEMLVKSLGTKKLWEIQSNTYKLFGMTIYLFYQKYITLLSEDIEEFKRIGVSGKEIIESWDNYGS